MDEFDELIEKHGENAVFGGLCLMAAIFLVLVAACIVLSCIVAWWLGIVLFLVACAACLVHLAKFMVKNGRDTMSRTL